jgi:hypothetical protein
MLRSTLLLLAVPLTGVLAQTWPIHLTIVSPNQTEIRLRSPAGDSTQVRLVKSTEMHLVKSTEMHLGTAVDSAPPPIVVRGRTELSIDRAGPHPDTFQTIELTALDSTSKIHVEVSQNDRVIASGDGSYLTVRRDVDGIVIEARSHAPASGAALPRKP